MTGADVTATFCATLVDEWIAGGVAHAVVAPGSRSTPLAVELAARHELAIHVVHDERVAAFVALGIGAGTGVAAVLLCTSGTAAANFLPAVVEAGLSAIPLIVATADRPPELQGVGAPQTIDQTNLYGTAVRWSHDAGVPSADGSASWRAVASEALARAAGGPVHLNLPFREPLLGIAGALPPGGGDERAPAGAPASIVDLPAVLSGVGGRVVILAGGASGVLPAAVATLAAERGWPVLADPLSRCRGTSEAVSAFDAILRTTAFADGHRPDVIIRIGRPAASKVLTQWVVGTGAPVIQVGGPGIIDPDRNVVAALHASALDVVVARLPAGPPGWAAAWIDASARAEQAIAEHLASVDALTEPAVARIVAEHRPPGGEVVVASSMPVRDYEWFGGPAATGFANRGANGIDGVVSTAVGIALAGRPTVVLIGDIAFVHDSGALTALRRRDADVRIVVVDNDGGGIFSFLPQATALGGDRFEQLFGTPHGTDIVALAAAHGVDAVTVDSAAALVARLETPGPSVTRVRTDRVENVAAHAALNAAVASALQTSP